MSLSETYGPQLPDDLPTFCTRFSEYVQHNPNELAIVALHQKADLYGVKSVALDNPRYIKDPYLRWTYKTLALIIDQFTAGLQEHGAEKGMPLITFIANGVEFLVAFFAASRLGCPFAPINIRNLVNIEEARHMVDICLQNASIPKPIFVAQDQTLADHIESLTTAPVTMRVLLDDANVKEGWKGFEDILEAGRAQDRDCKIINGHVPDDEAVFFTSGTTSLPKGCRWIHPQMATAAHAKYTMNGFVRGDKWASVMPNNHSYSTAITLIALCSGTAVVYPGPAFDPKTMLKALVMEECTHASLVPTMVLALAAAKEGTKQRLSRLRSIMLGGATLTPDVVHQCLEALGAEEIENAYGMTDGVYFSLGSQKPEIYISDNDVAAGKAIPGSALKVCAPGHTNPIPRDEVGELHYSSPILCNGYIGQASDDYYSDDQRRWIRTGDQAKMDDDGRIFVLGRFKDIIIRGGKNFASASMEATLAKVPKFAALNVQIVAAPDPIAGEVPVALTEAPFDVDIALEIQDVLRRTLGKEYVPDEVIYVGDLGMQAYPRTLLGKIKKLELAKLVKKFRIQREPLSQPSDDDQLRHQIRTLLAQAVGLSVQRLSDDTALSDFADSITMMRARNKIKKETGRSLSIVEFAEAGTIGKLLGLYQSRSPEVNQEQIQAPKHHNGPPSADHMVHLLEDPELYDATVEVISDAIGTKGFVWSDVRDVMPAYDFATVLARTGIFDSWNNKFAVLPNGKSKSDIRSSLKSLLKLNQILTSFFIWDTGRLSSDIALHVILDQSPKLFDQVILDGGTLKTVADLRDTPLRYPYPEHSRFPGPMAHFLLYDIEGTQNCGIVLNVNHAVIDASYGQILLEDFERVFGNDVTNANFGHQDYKLWADSYYSLRNSPEARRATKWHCNRLKKIGGHTGSLWPKSPSQRSYDGTTISGPDGVQHSFEEPNIRKFRHVHSEITSPVLVKTALALINVYKTGKCHALFANLEAARASYPFITQAMARTGHFEATEIAGPTIQSVINLVEIRPDESVSDLLQRMQAEQAELTNFASAPWHELMAALGEAGKMLPEVMRTQIFNWVPGMGAADTSPYKNFKLLNTVARLQVGLLVNAGMGGADGNMVYMHLRSNVLSEDDMRQVARELEMVTRWIVAEDNWNTAVERVEEILKS